MIWLFALLVFGATRLYNLNLLPIFADEAIYIRWAQLISQNWHNLFIPLTDGKTPLFMWLLAPLLKLNFDPLLTGRAVSVISGLLGVIGIYKLGQKLFDNQTAKIALTLAAFSPFLVFYDRMSLTDSLLSALIVWSAYFSSSYFLGPTAAAALLVKPSALATLIFIPLFNLKAWKKILVSAIAAFGLYNLLRFSDLFYMIKQRSLDYLQAPNLEHLLGTSRVFFNWLLSYLGWPLIFVLAISLIIAAKFREKKIAILTLFILVPFFSQALVGRILYPRYLLPLVPFILLIAAWGLNRLPKKLTALLIGLILSLWSVFDYYLITDPIKAPLPPAEKEQYFYTWAAGYGLKEIRSYLNTLPKDKKIVVATEGSFGTLPNGLEIYSPHNPNIQILGVGFPKGGISAGMEQALKDGKRVFLAVNKNRYPMPDINRIKLIAEYPRPAPNGVEAEKLLLYEIH